MRNAARSALVKLGVPLAAAGAATALLVAGSTAASASAISPLGGIVGHNGPVLITISGTPSSWNASGRYYEAEADDDWFGHIQIIGPNGFSRNGSDTMDPQLNNVISSGAGKVCSIGWQKNGDGTYSRLGEPCETVH
jgi:hypothetical protein